MPLLPRFHDDPAPFRAAAGDLLIGDPVRHTLALTVLQQWDPTVTGRSSRVLLTLHPPLPDGGRPSRPGIGPAVGAVVATPDNPVLVSAVPPELAPVAAVAMAEHGTVVPAVQGPLARAEAFAAAWHDVTGATARVEMEQRLFRLGDLVPPPDVPGHARPGTLAELGLLVAWRERMLRESMGLVLTPELVERQVRGGLDRGAAQVLWCVDGEPVAVASANRPLAGMSRIGGVYTPPEHRGHGYAAAVTAATARWALDLGAEQVLLFTVADNLVTNRLYPRLGFAFVADSVELAFETGGRPH